MKSKISAALSFSNISDIFYDQTNPSINHTKQSTKYKQSQIKISSSLKKKVSWLQVRQNNQPQSHKDAWLLITNPNDSPQQIRTISKNKKFIKASELLQLIVLTSSNFLREFWSYVRNYGIQKIPDDDPLRKDRNRSCRSQNSSKILYALNILDGWLIYL